MTTTIRYILGFITIATVVMFMGCKNPNTSSTYYIDGIAGNDSNSGDQDNPFERLTYAVSVAAPGDTLMLMPGSYRTTDGETFPITLKTGQRLIGNPGSHGVGTTIIGDGDVGGLNTATFLAADGNIFSGLEIQDSDTSNNYYGIFAEDAKISVSTCSFTNGYGGVYVNGSGSSIVSDNVFRTSSYGVYIGQVSGNITVDGNDLEGTMGLPINVTNAGSGTVISDNTITGNGSLGISLQYGTPLVTGNTFNYNNASDTDGYTNGAILNSNSTALIRSNIFDCHSPAVLIRDGAGVLDLGTAADPGGNDFSDVIGTSIVVESGVSDDIYAVGNTFPSNPPSSGSDGDIYNLGEAHVYYTGADYY